ncbi:hypothetical protein BY996DRAFT_8397425 [Phakopsora pachyrhizi]|nr:hypothetical protein BY996DRAFT_8397425 [Phakopsora pachyrhizi]
MEEPFSPPASSSPTTSSDIIKNSPGSSKHITVRTSHLPSCNLKRLPKSLIDLSSDTEDSKYHTDSASYNPGNPSSSGTELTIPENHIPDQINWSSDLSHLQQTFQLSSNPLRMHNSSSSSASSSTDSWDFDPDLIIPDEQDIGLISLIINPICPLQFQRTDDSEHDLHQLSCFEPEDEDQDEDEEQGEETGRGGTLRLKIIKPQQVQLFDCFKEPCLQQQLPHQKSNRTTINNTNLSLLISSSSRQEINDSLDSISSYLSSERQSTIKASITPTPTLTSTASSSTHESSPSQPPPN